MEIEARSRKRGPVRQRTRKPVRRNMEGPPDEDDDEPEPGVIGGDFDKVTEQ